jgi:hypothetical protein
MQFFVYLRAELNSQWPTTTTTIIITKTITLITTTIRILETD